MKQFVAFVKKHQPELLETEIFQDLIKYNKNPKGGNGYRPNGIWEINEVIGSHLTPYGDRIEMRVKLSKEEYEAFASKAEESDKVATDIYKLLHQFVYKNKDKYVIYMGVGDRGWTGFHIMTKDFIEGVGGDEFHKLSDSNPSIIGIRDRYVTDRNGVTIIIESRSDIRLIESGIDFSQIP